MIMLYIFMVIFQIERRKDIVIFMTTILALWPILNGKQELDSSLIMRLVTITCDQKSAALLLMCGSSKKKKPDKPGKDQVTGSFGTRCREQKQRQCLLPVFFYG